MTLDNLKSNWKHTGSRTKNQDQLEQMTKIKNHPNIKRMRIKFIFEAILLTLFLAIYFDGFDGATKPLWANVLLIATTITYILTRVVGWLLLRNPIKGHTLKTSLIRFQRQLRQMALSTRLTAFLFGAAIILFFSTAIDFTTEKYLLLAGMIGTLILLVYLSSRNWNQRIKGIQTTLGEFEHKVEL